MNHLLDESDDEPMQQHRRGGAEREITLGTTTILLIFFALAVYGAATFGFGYSMGSSHSATAPAAATSPTTNATFGNFSKPSPGSPLGAAVKAPVGDSATAPLTPPAATRTTAGDAERMTEPADNFTAPAKPPPAPAVAASSLSAGAPAGNMLVVQIAAVSHVEDAQMIASTLQKRGYSVNVMNEPDKLVHVQVGPFATRKDAEAMKARLLSDGFNAYIK